MKNLIKKSEIIKITFFAVSLQKIETNNEGWIDSYFSQFLNLPSQKIDKTPRKELHPSKEQDFYYRARNVPKQTGMKSLKV